MENEQAEQEVQEPSSAVSDEQLVAMLVDRARNEGLQPTGEGGLLQQLTKRVLESALEGEITDHVGYQKHDPAGKNNGNSRNGTRAKTVLSDVGPVEVQVPRETAGTFGPQIVGGRGFLPSQVHANAAGCAVATGPGPSGWPNSPNAAWSEEGRPSSRLRPGSSRTTTPGCCECCSPPSTISPHRSRNPTGSSPARWKRSPPRTTAQEQNRPPAA